jgi:hypothetical protein
MNINVTRKRFLGGFLGAVFFPVWGVGGSAKAAECRDENKEKARLDIIKKLQVKHPSFSFDVLSINYVPDQRLPYWHAQAVTINSVEKKMIFAMRYCGGSVELSALTAFKP